MKKTLAAVLIFVAGLLLLVMVIRWFDAWSAWRFCVAAGDPSLPGCADVGASLLGRLSEASFVGSFAGLAAWAAFWLDADPTTPSPRQDLARRIGMWAPAWLPGLALVALILGTTSTSVALGGGFGIGMPLSMVVPLLFFSVPLVLFVGAPVALVAWRVGPPRAVEPHAEPSPG
ncbi:MAG TPA: hypothetical protein VIG64_12270 [Actinomycetota bacterium]|jgi:hypothetical protein